MATKYLDNTGLAYFWDKIKNWVTSRGYITSSGSITGNAATASAVAWSGVTGKPSTFSPSSHAHGSITNDGKLGTASRVVVTDGNEVIDVSSVTAAELGYLSGVTSAVQTQLDAKAADSGVVHNAGNETVAGSKIFSSTVVFGTQQSGCRGTASSYTQISGGSAFNKGGRISLNGESYSNAGYVQLRASAAATKVFELRPDGTATWDGNAIQTSSDERIKTPLESVPDEVLDAWGDVQWGEFKFLDAVERKGESARLHLGLIAQRVKAVFEARGLNACAYGILCYENREADGEEPAVDLWTIRYTEALAMEAAYQRRRADRLEARIAVIEEMLK